MKKYTCGSFFGGVGGIDLGFQYEGFETIYMNEIDPFPAATFECNFPVKVDVRDINVVQPDEIPDFDVITGGFPCQSFSVAGLRQGFDDEKNRGTLFFQLIRIMEKKRPRVCFFENVKNLVGHDHGNTFKVICGKLEELGYKVKSKVLNTMEYGNVPQTRERIYIVGFREEEDYDRFEFPKPIPLTKTIRDFIDFENPVDESFYYTKEKYDCFDMIKDGVKRSDTLYQWRRVYVRENKSNVCPTLTCNMGTGGHNVPLILTDDGRIRKLTPRECFNLQGFPKDFKLPKQSNGRLYKQSGNSVSVPVIQRIAANIKKVLDEK